MTNGFSKLRYHIRFKSLDALFAMGLGGGFLKASPGKRILLYHGVLPDALDPTRFNTRFIRQSVFEEHLRWLRDHTQVLSLEDFCQRTGESDDFCVALTFDDGYRNNLEYVLPLLEKYQLPATFFINALHRYPGPPVLVMDLLDIFTHTTGIDKIEIDGKVFYKKSGNLCAIPTGHLCINYV